MKGSFIIYHIVSILTPRITTFKYHTHNDILNQSHKLLAKKACQAVPNTLTQPPLWQEEEIAVAPVVAEKYFTPNKCFQKTRNTTR